MGTSFHLSYTVLKGNFGNSKNKGTFLWNFVPNSGLFDRRNLLPTKLVKDGRSERNKLDRRRSTIDR